MENTLPKHAKISKDSITIVQKCATEFIACLTAELMEPSIRGNRTSITTDDIICALESLGFEHYVEHVKNCLVEYEKIQATGKKTTTTMMMMKCSSVGNDTRFEDPSMGKDGEALK